MRPANLISSSLPDAAAFTGASSPPAANTVIFSRTAQPYHYPSHPTPYLFVTNFETRGNYILNGRDIDLFPRSFYFTNPNDTLAINLPSLPVETLLILFDPAFLTGCLRASTADADRLLDNPAASSVPEIQIPGLPFELSAAIRDRISVLLQDVSDKEEMDAKLQDLLIAVFRLLRHARQDIDQITAVRRSTRDELYRRLFQARALLQENIFSPLTIGQIAAAACMDKFHFITSFRQLYRITPYQYLKQLRLEKARELLLDGKDTVTEVCYRLGFESVGSFSNSFRKKYRISPSQVKSAGNSQF